MEISKCDWSIDTQAYAEFNNACGYICNNCDGYGWHVSCGSPPTSETQKFNPYLIQLIVAKGVAPSMQDAQYAAEVAFEEFDKRRKTECNGKCLECPLRLGE